MKKGVLVPTLGACFALALSAVLTPAQAEVKQSNVIVKSVTGTASYVDEYGLSHELTEGTELKTGDVVSTGAESAVEFLVESARGLIGLDSNSKVRLARVSYQEGLMGTTSETLLELKEGQLIGDVEKLSAGSKFEVATSKLVASVRGTRFSVQCRPPTPPPVGVEAYIETWTGTVHVTKGIVYVTVVLDLPPSGLPGDLVKKDIPVAAGQSLYIPSSFANEQAFNQLHAVSTPCYYNASTLKLLNKLFPCMMARYAGPNNKGYVTEVFAAKYAFTHHIDGRGYCKECRGRCKHGHGKGPIIVCKPPKHICVSM
jgi:hypothetical protein